MKKNRLTFGAGLALAVMAVIAVPALVGCKKADDAGAVKVLNYFDMTMSNSSDEITTVWNAFSDANPDIKIVREDLFNEPFHNKVEAYAASGQIPDVIYAWPSGRSTTLHTKRLLKDLSSLAARDGLQDGMIQGSLDPSLQGGGYIAIIPRAMTSSHAFYVNNEVLADCGLQPAKTYAELKAQVPVLKAKGYDTVLMSNQETWVMQSCLFSLIAGRFGGANWADDILSGKSKFTDKNFVDALNFVKTLYDDGVLSKNTLSTGYGDVIGQFANNKGAYLVDGDWRIGAFITDKTTGQAAISAEKQQNIQITVFPTIEGAQLNGSTSVILGTGWGMNASIPEGSEKEEAAWKLIKWLSGKEVQTWLLETGGIATPTRSDIDVASLNLEPMQVAGSLLTTQYTTGTPVIDGVFAGDVYTPLNDGMQEIGLGTKTPEQVAESVQKAYEAWLNK
ncbi:MAG: extracellular solute-binding protein [Treponemataceae bacterium]|nr:MAG: extracellular solute-binding protein [Treponemataceae bacterium]